MTIYARRGSKSITVKKIQEKLNVFYGVIRNSDGSTGKRLVPDSDFGPTTEQVVKEYQSEQGLIPDGIVGNFSYAVLMETTHGFLLPRPKMVAQGASQKCWAATTESWLAAYPGKRNQRMDDIVSAGMAAGVVTANGGLRISSGDVWWMSTFDLEVHARQASEFFAETAYSRLRKHRKPLPLGLRASTGGEGHIALMYGVQAKAGELYILAMEPFRARYHKLKILDVQVIAGTIKTWTPKP